MTIKPPIKLYDLAGADGRRFSSNCWRSQFALAHKGLAYETVPTKFTEISAVCGGGHKTIPVIEDGATQVCDSWAIANYLEETYPDRPSVFGDGASGDAPGGAPGGARGFSLFLQHWGMRNISFPLLHIIIKDIYDRLDEADQPYFRETREKRFGKTLEELVENRDETMVQFRDNLKPLRTVLADQRYLSGAAPLYPDYIVTAALLWVRIMSPVQLLADDDPLNDWFNRMLDQFDGLARNTPKEWVGV
jgi:glutathione S-transferase